jgi:23S rRNA G2445 N2-methylase RlmL
MPPTSSARSWWDRPGPVRLLFPHGHGFAVAAELNRMGFPPRAEGPSFVEVSAPPRAAIRMCVWSRSAHRIIVPLREFSARSLDQFAGECARIPWDMLLGPDHPITVTCAVQTPAIRDHRIVNLRCKDVIVDRLAAVHGRRPDSGPGREGLCVFVHWNGLRCSVALDMCGEPLTQRGYRAVAVEAPMREPLAATILSATGYDGSVPLVNPMCGSGTLAIEAAWIAAGIPPGVLRPRYAFESILGYEPEWRVEAEQHTPRDTGLILATDHDPRAIEAARVNAECAGVRDRITFEVCDVEATPVPPGQGIMVVNPPYGVRLSNEGDLRAPYSALGRFFRKHPGFTSWVITSDSALLQPVGLTATSRRTLHNGDLDCRLVEYHIHAPPPTAATTATIIP